ncbi:hypothetical protein KDK_62450 [Dictyobacter kobayashii]|uniref:Uncharacterized protein n=1 Tax=Dictyobacter kobayashii TaxID=2014872 RepID=A0A402ATQ3_9CHLR|nr:hypothetical protein KDK_62450 [Dictyobacter kobayashii]
MSILSGVECVVSGRSRSPHTPHAQPGAAGAKMECLYSVYIHPWHVYVSFMVWRLYFLYRFTYNV